MFVQWNLRIKDTLGLGPAILSTIERLSSSRRSKKCIIAMGNDNFGTLQTVLSREAVLFSEAPL